VGQKVHPHGFRLGILYDWESKWFAERDYRLRLHQDLELRQFVLRALPDASISRLEIDRNANLVTVTIHTAKPGIVIGRGGAKVEELRNSLERATGTRVRVNIQEIRTPELDATLVARSVAEQLERRVAFRRAIKQAVQRTMQRGALGVRIAIAGRLGGAEMSRRESESAGQVLDLQGHGVARTPCCRSARGRAGRGGTAGTAGACHGRPGAHGNQR
jgi:small subunit ribosomal protein S3